jgi:alkylglycerol monooxygenase
LRVETFEKEMASSPETVHLTPSAFSGTTGSTSGNMTSFISSTPTELVWKFTKGLLQMFYIVNPSSTVFHSLEEVPQYIVEATPYFFSMLLIEVLILSLKSSRTMEKIRNKVPGKHTLPPRLNDSLTSISAGMVQQLSKLVIKNIELATYIYIHEHFRLPGIQIDTSQFWVWIFTFLGVDMGYYWFHRAAHELNLFWAAHSVHHSSEEYNLSTALRQSAFQSYFSWVFYLPLALLIPPPMFAVHMSLNTLYQFWIHTCLVPKLGFLEYILNTPSSHRVHHGRNPYCIDTNYAGTLIIWDILFGTYQSEKDDEPVLFGLTHNINSFDLFWVQWAHFNHIFKSIWNTRGLWNKFCILFAGPGWTPANPQLRLGDPKEIPRVPNLMETPDADIGIYNPDLLNVHKGIPKTGTLTSAMMATYILVQFVVILATQYLVMSHTVLLTRNALLAVVCTIMLSLWVVGAVLDSKKSAYVFESLRLGVVVPLVSRFVVRGEMMGRSGMQDPLVGVLSLSQNLMLLGLKLDTVNVLDGLVVVSLAWFAVAGVLGYLSSSVSSATMIKVVEEAESEKKEN